MMRRQGGGGTVTREFLIQILANDQSSAALKKAANNMLLMGNASLKAFGQYMVWTRVGQTMSNVGDSILRAAGAAGKMAADFDYQMRLVRTQTNLTNKQFQDLVNKALDVSSKVPQSASDVAQGLYDIFSSTDVGYKKAVYMIKNFAIAATSGGTDITTVERSIISEMNAFHLPVSQTTHLLNLQFQMVRYGVGTYEDFASAIGNMLPAGRSMGQTLETLAGAAAFMSRNGFTAAQATISVARALDQLTRHRQDIKDTLGIDIVDKSTGQYKQLNVIMGEFAKKMAGMTGPQREAAFKSMFGAGEIRAMRFFRVAIPNFAALQKMTDHMGASGGALNRAFGDVKTSPLIQFRILLNSVRVSAIRLADEFLPYAIEFLKVIKDLMLWFGRVPAPMRHLIALMLILAGAFLSVAGRIVFFMGSLKGIASIMGLTGDSMTALLGPVGLVIIAVAALALGAYFLIKNWKAVSTWWERNWKTIVYIAGAAVAFLAPLLSVFLVGKLVELGAAFMDLVKVVRMSIGILSAVFKSFLASNWIVLVIGLVILAAYLIITHWGAVKRFLLKVWDDIKKAAVAVWNWLVRFYSSTTGKIVRAILVPWTFLIGWLIDHWQGVVTAAGVIWGALTVVFNKVIMPLVHFLQTVWDIIVANAKVAFQILYTVFSTSLAVLVLAWTVAWDIVSLAWKILWQGIKIYWYAIGYPVFLVIRTIIELQVKYIVWLWNHVLRPAWDALWRGIHFAWENVGHPIFTGIRDVARWLWNNVLHPTFTELGREWNDIWTKAKWVWQNIGAPVLHAISLAFQGLRKGLGIVWGDITRAWSAFWVGLEAVAGRIVNGILGVVEAFVNFFINALNWVRTKFGLDAIGKVSLGRVHWGDQGGGGGGGGSQGHLAKGTKNWRGGWAWVGEEGPEVMYVPKNAQVWTHSQSKKLFGSPDTGFALGLEPPISIPGIGGALDWLGKAIGMGISKGTGFLVNAALKLFHVHAPLIKNMVMTGAELFTSLKNSFFTWAKGLLGKVQVSGGGTSFSGQGGIVGGWGPAGSPNANVYRNAVQAAWPGLRFAGIYNRRFIAGTNVWSQHAYGNAVDEMVPSLSYGDQVRAWVAGRAGMFHLAHLLWRVPGHFNHIHADFWPQGIGTPRAGGGWINEPILGVGRSGRTYSFGERESEYITPASKMGNTGGHTFNFYGIHQHDTGEIIRAINWELATDRH
jgi:TP901 family phage tail tape measure protein